MSLYLVTSIFAIPYRVSLLFVWIEIFVKLFSCIMGCAWVYVCVCVCACVLHLDSCVCAMTCSCLHHNLFIVYRDSRKRATSWFMNMCVPWLVLVHVCTTIYSECTVTHMGGWHHPLLKCVRHDSCMQLLCFGLIGLIVNILLLLQKYWLQSKGGFPRIHLLLWVGVV